MSFHEVPGNPSPVAPPPALPLPAVLGVLALRPVLLAVSWLVLLLAVGAAALPGALLWQNVVIVAVDLVSIAVVVALLHRHGRRARDLIALRASDWWRAPLTFLIVMVGFVAASYVGNLVAYAGPPPADTEGGFTVPLWLGVWSLALMPLTIGVAEELVYRGIGQGGLTRRWGRWAGWLVAAAFFGVQHFFLTPPDPQAWLARFVTTFLAGLLFGALYWWHRRLAPLIIAHVLLDVVGLGLPMLYVALAAGA